MKEREVFVRKIIHPEEHRAQKKANDDFTEAGRETAARRDSPRAAVR